MAYLLRGKAFGGEGSGKGRQPPVVLSVIAPVRKPLRWLPVVRELQKHPYRICSKVCAAAQHKEMMKDVFDLFSIHRDFDLDVMTSNQTLPLLTAKLIQGLDSVVEKAKPDWVLAEGDTITVLAAGLVSFYRRLRFGHVETGLRTGNFSHPFPEEMNRRVADVLATLFFPSTESARQSLLNEGVDPKRIHVTGNTLVDALFDVAARPFDWCLSPISLFETKQFVLITAHRRESFGKTFRDLCHAIRELAAKFLELGIQFIYPVHLNPNVRNPVSEILSGIVNVHLNRAGQLFLHGAINEAFSPNPD